MQYAWYSREAADLYSWALEEVNRIKALRILKVALSLEERWRENYQGIVNDPYRRPITIPLKPPNRGSFVRM